MLARETVACGAALLVAGSLGCGSSRIPRGSGKETKASVPTARECADVPNGIPTSGRHAPFEVVDTQQEVRNLTVDESFAYWVVDGGGEYDFRIMRVSLAGGVPVELAHLDGNPWAQLVLDDERVYWATPSHLGLRIPGSVGSVSKNGSVPEILYSDVGFNGQAWLVVDDTFVYWTDFEKIQRIPKRTPGKPEELVESLGQGIAEDAANLYWANYGQGTLGTIAKDGGDAFLQPLDFDCPRQVRVSCGRVFFDAELVGSGFYTWDLTAGEARYLSEFAGGPFPIDSRYAYTGLRGLLYRVDLDTGLMDVLDDVTMGAREIVVNDTHIYWTSDDTGGVIWGMEK